MLKQNIIALKLIILSFILYIKAQKQNLTTKQVIEIAEKQLGILAEESKRLYSQKCNETCDKKLYNECSLFSPQMYCEKNFPYNKNCAQEGNFMSWETAGGRCVQGSDCDSKFDKEIICTQARLFDLNENGDSIRHDINSPILYQYVGFINGFRTVYPYKHPPLDSNNQCTQFDPRYRPWYVGAATGVKNVIMILDCSISMDQEERFHNVQQAAYTVIDTLGIYDQFTIIAFSQTATSSSNTLVKATIQNKEKAKQFINDLEFGDLTNYEAAYTLAFDILNLTSSQQEICGETIILFLTDGLPTAGLGSIDTTKDIQDQLQQINQQNPIFQQWLQDQMDKIDLQITIFVYAIGSYNGQDFSKQMACNNRGIFYHIKDSISSVNLIEQMRQYYDYLAQGLEQKLQIWSEVYSDAFTQRDVITVAQPIYVENEFGVRLLLGVAGIDIDVDSIKGNSDYNEVINSIYQNQKSSCDSFIQLSECQLRELRGDHQCSNVQICEQYKSNFDNCQEIISANQWVTQHQVNKDGQQIQYSVQELTTCCPIVIQEQNQSDGSNKINQNNLMLLLLFIFIITLNK